MRDCVRWSIQNKNKVPLLLLRKILYIQKPCLTLPARHGFWTKSNPFPYRPCRNWRNFSRKNSKKLWFYEVFSLFTQPNGFIVETKATIFSISNLLISHNRSKRVFFLNRYIPVNSCCFSVDWSINWCKWCRSLFPHSKNAAYSFDTLLYSLLKYESRPSNSDCLSSFVTSV